MGELLNIYQIGNQIYLYHRSCHSIYLFIRRCLRPFKKGRWTSEETQQLVQFMTNFGNKSRKWSLAAKILNRSPESIADKWKEICPEIHSKNQSYSDNLLVYNENQNGNKLQYSQRGVNATKLINAVKNVHNGDVPPRGVLWKAVQKSMPTYSVNQLRGRYATIYVKYILGLKNIKVGKFDNITANISPNITIFTRPRNIIS